MESHAMYANHCARTPRVTTVDLSLEEHSHRAYVRTLVEAIPLFEKIESWMQGYAYPRIDRFAVALALRESVINAVEHGHAADPTKLVQITFAVRRNEVVIEVEDQGPGYDPTLVPSPLQAENRDRHHGWGLFMMQSYATWMTIDPPGNRVTFGRRRSEN
jgi:serine/threonine-protein kinase RsbW